MVVKTIDLKTGGAGYFRVSQDKTEAQNEPLGQFSHGSVEQKLLLLKLHENTFNPLTASKIIFEIFDQITYNVETWHLHRL